MTKQRQKSFYRSLGACALLLFAGMVMAPILSATGKLGSGKAAPAAPSEPAVAPAQTPATAGDAGHRPLPVVRLSPRAGDYDGAEYAGTSGGGDSFYAGGQDRPHYGALASTFTGSEIGGGAGGVPVFTPYDYFHYGPGGGGRSSVGASFGGGQGGGGNDGQNPQPGQPGGGDQPNPNPNPGPNPGPDPDQEYPPTNPEEPPVVEVPEPSALALLMVGIAGLLVARRRAR